MLANKQNLPLWTAGVAAILSVSLGWLYPHPLLALVGTLAILYLIARLAMVVWQRQVPEAEHGDKQADPWAQQPPEVLHRTPVDPTDTAALVESMMAQGRFALLLRPQIAPKLEEDLFQRAMAALEEGMALVPDGEVVVGQVEDGMDESQLTSDEIAARHGRVVRVDLFFLDRYPVTNHQFYEFVAGGGYQQSAFWEPSILPAVLDFVDQTGAPGPRFWKHGRYDPALRDHPVVGVSWYEAAAYARWVGKRLPTDAEWVKAASWPVSVSATSRVQRRYPWGDTMDRARAHLWGSGVKGTVPVDQYPTGVSVGGVYHLIGNVWEWMRGNFSPPEMPGEQWLIETPMKNIRGAAFDTYFDNQATCQFSSGEAAIARKHNIGFRCAVGVCDLVLSRTGEALPMAAETEEEHQVPAEVAV